MADQSQSKKDSSTNTRAHLANERTFLAWIRTSIATITFGFFIARFTFWLREISVTNGNKPNLIGAGFSLPIGLSMIAFGGIMAFLATTRYLSINHAIDHGQEHPGFKPIILYAVTGGVIAISLILIFYLIITSHLIG